jgi:hypothetical protein
MTKYAILLPDDEDRWEQATPEQRAEVYARHGEFTRRLAEEGHQMVGGAELTHSRDAKVVRGGPGRVSVTDGPYAELVEQLSGLYLVETDDLDGLLQLCGLLVGIEGGPADGGAVEVRVAVGADERQRAVSGVKQAS